MHVRYTGDKHCELVHGPSGSVIETDAPKDNQGRGERFSPTDLMGAALASCILTTLAIVAERDGIVLQGAEARVTKEMHQNPRRVARLPVVVRMPGGISQPQRSKLEMIAHTCPVHRSLHPEIEAPITFIYPDEPAEL
ncbi:MAG: OsmC family protein [Bdellovibrionaceae bacterium]|nr:OsmC family protein [Pseudobdellovibrionaceae bacterium]